MDFNMCRVCMGKGFLKNIFETRGSTLISTAVTNISNVKIYPNDGLPDKICNVCVKKLDSCIKFTTMCQDSDMKLRTLLYKTSDEDSQTSLHIDLGHETYAISIEGDTFNESIREINSENLFQFANEQKYNVDDKSELVKSAEKKTITSLSYKDEQNSSDIKSKAVKQQCFTCGKVMSSRFRLKTHLRTHTGERPFSCLHCSKTFTLEQNLKVHMRVHTGEKPLQCSVCGKSFAHTAGLTAHKRKHSGQTPYHCVLCPRSFRTHGHLQYHVRRHTGEKNFECDLCSKSFITRSGLKQHLLSHTGDRPHACSVCGKRMTRASHVKRHMIQAHQNDEPSEHQDEVS